MSAERYWEGRSRDEKAENERLRAGLQRYGLHTWDCAYNDSKGEQPCDCGWKELLTELCGADVEEKTDAS